MDSVGEYLISVTGAALVCSGIVGLMDKARPAHAILRLISNIFLLIVMINPILNVDLTLSIDSLEAAFRDADSVVDGEVNAFSNSQQAYINEHLEAYVQQKLDSLNCDLRAEFTLQDSYPYEPVGIQLRGTVSPYLRTYTSNWLHTELGIPAEDQQWMG